MAKSTSRPTPKPHPRIVAIRKTGWNPPPPGPARDRYTQEFIAGKLSQMCNQMKKGK
jgi:hypothetical protein